MNGESEEHFRRLVENSPDVILRWHPIHGVEYINQAIERIAGYRPDEVVGNMGFLATKVHPEDVLGLIAALQDSTDTAVRGPVEFRLQGKNGKLVWFEALFIPIYEGLGILAGVECMARDITAAKNTEEQLHQAQKMDAVGRLAGGIAHDFNNLLTAINGYCEMLLGELPEAFPMRQEIEEIQKAGERATELTRRLLLFARQNPEAAVTLDLNDLIMGTDKMLRRMIGANIELIFLPASGPLPIRGDRVKFEQVVMNLAVNARDAMPAGGKLVMRTSCVTPNTNGTMQPLPPGDYARLDIEDTGCGMPDEVKAHLYEPFFTTKPPGAGTGLGLATSYGIMRQVGGRIECESEPERGTIFRLYFPISEWVEGSSERGERTLSLPFGTETILLVEDNELVRDFTAQALRCQGYEVLEAADGLDATLLLRRPETRSVSLIVTDVVMPMMGGYDLAREAHTVRPDLRILFVSGYVRPESGPYSVMDARMAFLQKPYTPMALAVKVRELLDRQQ